MEVSNTSCCKRKTGMYSYDFDYTSCQSYCNSISRAKKDYSIRHPMANYPIRN